MDQAQGGSDAEVVARVKAGSTEDYRYLVERYQRYVAAIVARHVPPEVVDEIVSQAFVNAYQAIVQLKEGDSFKAWVARVAVRRSYDYWRAAKRRPEVVASSLGQEDQELLSWCESDKALEAHQATESQSAARVLIQRALNHLSAEDRMVIQLVYLEERSIQDAAQLLGWTTVNVKVRSYRVRRHLRRVIQEWLS